MIGPERENRTAIQLVSLRLRLEPSDGYESVQTDFVVEKEPIHFNSLCFIHWIWSMNVLYDKLAQLCTRSKHSLASPVCQSIPLTILRNVFRSVHCVPRGLILFVLSVSVCLSVSYRLSERSSEWEREQQEQCTHCCPHTLDKHRQKVQTWAPYWPLQTLIIIISLS